MERGQGGTPEQQLRISHLEKEIQVLKDMLGTGPSATEVKTAVATYDVR